MSTQIEIRPNPGPQEAYLATSADMAFFGGAAGGGKTYATLLDGLRWYADPDFDGVLFRREAVDLRGPGKVWDEAVGLFSLFGGSPCLSPLEWRFPSGAAISFTHLQHEKDKYSHQGAQYSWIAFEELTHFTEGQFWYLWGRRRTKAKLRPYLRATCNPDPDSWVRKMVDWWIGPDGYAIPERSGVIRYFVRDGDELVWADTREELEERFGDPERVTSFTFILSRLSDNPKVDPTYRAALLALPLVERERLLGDEARGGNWDIRPVAGNFFRRAWWTRYVDSADELDVIVWMRGWDLAATEPNPDNKDPDWTRGAKVGITRQGHYVIADMASERGTPGAVEKLLTATAELDGPNVTIGLFQDPAQAGKSQAAHYVDDVLADYAVDVLVASANKQALAKIWSPMVERGEFILVRGPWNAAFIAEGEAFPPKPGKGHDDQIDAVSRAVVFLREFAGSLGFLDAMVGRGGLRGALRR